MSKKEYIEKDAAIDYLTLNTNWYDEDGVQVDDWGERKAIYSDLLSGIPPADVKPVVHGEWIWKPDKRWWECDQCGEKTTDACMGKPRANYCPWCGADMRKEANDER